MPAVLLTGSRAPATLDLARRFTDEGYSVVVADSQPALTSSSRVVTRAYRVPSARFRPWEFAAAVGGIARRHAVDLVVPSCEEIFWLAAVVEEAAATAPGVGVAGTAATGRADSLSTLGGLLFAPPIGVLRRLHDKAAFGELLAGLGVAHPETVVIASRIAWRRAAERRRARPSGALVVKPAFSRFGTRTRFVAAGEPLPEIERVTRDEPWLVQQRVVGTEFCSYAVAVGGELTAFAAYRPDWRAGNGAGVVFTRLDERSGPAAEARRIAELLARRLELTGQFGLDLMATPAGVQVLECNPRATSGVHLFDAGDGLAGAFSGEAARPPGRRSARLAVPHALYAAAGIRRPADAARWFGQLRAPDVLRPPADPLPVSVLLRSLAVQVATSRRMSVPLTAGATHDLEYGGEPLPLRPVSARPGPPHPAGDAPVSAEDEEGESLARFVSEVAARGGTSAVAANVAVDFDTVRVGRHLLPVTVSYAGGASGSASRGPRVPDASSYVVSPHTHYVRYAREELGEVRSAAARRAARAALFGLDRVLRAGRVDDAVIVGNALLSTNLLPDLDEGAIVATTRELVAAHPQRAVIWRSVHGRGTGLPGALRRAGYLLIPSRSVVFTATRDAEWLTLRDVRRDRSLFEGSGYRVRRLAAADVQPGDDAIHARIAELYTKLYIEKYSTLNPQYTPAFIDAARRSGLLEFTLLERGGRVDAVLGARVAHGLLAAPVVGYETHIPQETGLYRMLSYLIALRAHERGVDLHNSSGVAEFKRNRGGEPELEYTAVYARHLPAGRRAAWATLEALVTNVAAPLVQRNGL